MPQLVELRVDAVAREAAVARERRRLVDERAPIRSRTSARSSSPAARLRSSGAWNAVELGAHARHGGARLAQRDEVARPGGAERRARHQPLEVVHRLQRLAEPAALGRAERRAPRRRRAGRESARATSSGRSSQARSSRPPIEVTVRSISCSSDPCAPPSLPVTTSRCFSVIGSMIEALGRGAIHDGAHVREVRLLRVAQVVRQAARGLHRGLVPVRGRSPRGRGS